METGEECERCKQRHVTGKEMRTEADRLGYSSRDLASSYGYAASTLRLVMNGVQPITCRMNERWQMWQKSQPQAVLYKWGFRKGERGRSRYVEIWRIALELTKFRCLGCGEEYLGRKGQKWCPDSVCNRLRRDGMANPETQWRIEQDEQARREAEKEPEKKVRALGRF